MSKNIVINKYHLKNIIDSSVYGSMFSNLFKSDIFINAIADYITFSNFTKPLHDNIIEFNPENAIHSFDSVLENISNLPNKIFKDLTLDRSGLYEPTQYGSSINTDLLSISKMFDIDLSNVRYERNDIIEIPVGKYLEMENDHIKSLCRLSLLGQPVAIKDRIENMVIDSIIYDSSIDTCSIMMAKKYEFDMAHSINMIAEQSLSTGEEISTLIRDVFNKLLTDINKEQENLFISNRVFGNGWDLYKPPKENTDNFIIEKDGSYKEFYFDQIINLDSDGPLVKEEVDNPDIFKYFIQRYL